MSEVEIFDQQPPHPALYPDDPVSMVQLATAQANELAQVIDSRQLYATISGRKHVTVQGWTLLGAMTGVFPVTEWSRPIDVDGDRGWEARVVAVHLASDRVVGAAEGMCLRSESTWSKRDEYALRSMAETRARSKALRGPLEFVMELAGFQTTPAEEMPRDEAPRRGTADSPSISAEHLEFLNGWKTDLAMLPDGELKDALLAQVKSITDGYAMHSLFPDEAEQLVSLAGEYESQVAEAVAERQKAEEPFNDPSDEEVSG